VATLSSLSLDRHLHGPRQDPAPPQSGPPRMAWRRDLVTAGLSTWLLFGIFLDGWAHNTRPTLETFFTPWHAVFYAGFLALAGWILWMVWPERRSARGAVGRNNSIRPSGCMLIHMM
jgi:hypothetical protein